MNYVVAGYNRPAAIENLDITPALGKEFLDI